MASINSVAKTLEGQILNGQLGDGASMPSERDLASQLGVSRSTVREGFRLLEERGLIETRSGRGARVARALANKPAESIALWAMRSEVSPRNLIEARICIELEAVRLAAQNQSALDPELGLRILSQIQTSGDAEESSSLDIAFHLYLSRLSGNPLYEVFLTTLAPLTSQLIRESSKDEKVLKRRQLEHQRILGAINAGNVEDAVSFMKLHLEAGYEFLPEIDSPRLSLNLEEIKDFDARIETFDAERMKIN